MIHRLDSISEVLPSLNDAVPCMGARPGWHMALGRESPAWGAGSLQETEFSQKQPPGTRDLGEATRVTCWELAPQGRQLLRRPRAGHRGQNWHQTGREKRQALLHISAQAVTQRWHRHPAWGACEVSLGNKEQSKAGWVCLREMPKAAPLVAFQVGYGSRQS